MGGELASGQLPLVTLGEGGASFAGVGEVSIGLLDAIYHVRGTAQFRSFAADAQTPVMFDVSAAHNCQLVVEKGSVFDFSRLQPGSKVIFNDVHVYFQAGSGLALAHDIDIEFRGKSSVTFEQSAGVFTAGAQDAFVRFFGDGRIIFKDQANMLIGRGACCTVVTVGTCDNTFSALPAPAATELERALQPSALVNNNLHTGIVFEFNDDASCVVKSGGVLQVGNLLDIPSSEIHSSFSINGPGAYVRLEEGAFLGFGVAPIDMSDPVPRNWTVQPLYNCQSVSMAIPEGQLLMQAYPASDERASLWMFGGEGAKFSFRAAYQEKGKADLTYGAAVAALTSTQSTSGSPISVSQSLVRRVTLMNEQRTKQEGVMGDGAQHLLTFLAGSGPV